MGDENDYLIIGGEKKTVEEWRTLWAKLNTVFGYKEQAPYYPYYYPYYDPRRPQWPPYEITWTDGTAVYSASGKHGKEWKDK